ncbi:unnamed protein product, partial [Cyprideis torosa]
VRFFLSAAAPQAFPLVRVSMGGVNVVEAVRLYLLKMVGDARDSSPLRVLLMDSDTIGIVTMAVSKSEMLQRNVFLFERLAEEAQRPVALDRLGRPRTLAMKHLTCLTLVRPTAKSVADLCAELRSPRYGSYYLSFTNRLEDKDLKLLARADEHEVVRQVQEVFADYVPVMPWLFSLNLAQCYKAPETGTYQWDTPALDRTAQGLHALLQALGKPDVPHVRYQGNSPMCRDLASALRKRMQQVGPPSHENSVVSCGNTGLLILDRRNDPVTPLLNQWTYQAMVHEILGIHSNTVALPNAKGEW